MRLKLFHKLFFVNILVVLILTSISLTLNYMSNTSLLSRAMNGIDEKVLESLAKLLAKDYEASGSWAELQDAPQRWKQTVEGEFLRVFFLHAFQGKSPPMPDVQAPQSELEPCKAPFATFFERVSLLDQKRLALIDAPVPVEDANYQRIKVNGEIVGWLRVGKINVDVIPLAEHFFEQQLKLSIWVSLIGGLIALAISYWLSKQFTLPLKKIHWGAHQLARRKFDVQLPITSNDEIGVVAQDINLIADELNRFQSLQRQWLMDISHELRTPLTILYGEIAAIKDNITRWDDSVAESISEELIYIKRLIDDLHELSVLDRVDFRLKKDMVNLSPLFLRTTSLYRDRFANKNIALNYRSSTQNTTLMVDGDRIEQVIKNILENGLRYIDAPGEIEVTLQIEHAHLIITFDDSGPGVPPAELGKIFDRLYRVDKSRSRASGGSGLGLSICRSIIQAHHGAIEAKISPLGGLRIQITLPISGAGER